MVAEWLRRQNPTNIQAAAVDLQLLWQQQMGGGFSPQLTNDEYPIAMQNGIWAGMPVWAGDLEIQAISELFQVQLQLWSNATGTWMPVSPPHGDQHATTITLAYNAAHDAHFGLADGNGR